ncbi:hypothetical protein B0H14DRAFT_2250400, partial [Mycena olivaceomarginata]
INEMIDELGRIVDRGSGGTDKAAIIWRVVQYIHDLKQKEVRSIENCSLEKLSLDDAIEGLKVQAANMARMLDEERVKR